MGIRSQRITDYLQSLARTEDNFAKEQSLDSTTWGLNEALRAASFYQANLAYTKRILERAEADIQFVENDIRQVLEAIEKWSRESPFKESA